MITRRLILQKYSWAITILADCDCSDVEDIILHLKSIECPQKLQDQAVLNLNQCKLNTGLTYSNYLLRRTIMVINKTNDVEELMNTITHESFHFIAHLSKACSIKEEETLATLLGDFNMNMCDIIFNILKIKD